MGEVERKGRDEARTYSGFSDLYSFQLQCSHHRDLPFIPELIPVSAQMQLNSMAFLDDPF
jgi:hypothetical protein